MVIINFDRHEVREVLFRTTIEAKSTVSLRNSFSFNVEYYDNNTRGIAKLIQKVQENSPAPRLELSVTMLGYFSCGGVHSLEDKKHAHLQAYNQLFPYVRSLIATMTAAGGLPALTIPKGAMDWDNIRVD